MCVDVLPGWMDTTCGPGACRGQRRALGPLKLELQTLVCLCVCMCTTYKSQDSPFTMCVLGIELRSSAEPSHWSLFIYLFNVYTWMPEYMYVHHVCRNLQNSEEAWGPLALEL